MYTVAPVKIIVKKGKLLFTVFEFGDAKLANLEEDFFDEKSLLEINLVILMILLFIFFKLNYYISE